MDSSRCFTFYDADRRIVLLPDSNNLKDGNKLRYLSEKNQLLYTEIYFDSSNRSIKNIRNLKSLFVDTATVKDSVTLLVCLLLDAGKNILESRIIFSNDIACSAAFKRRILYDKYFIRSLDYKNYKVLNQVLIIFKEFTCHTSTTHSTFN